MPQIFEAIMVICFGVSWPISIAKSYTSKTAKGKSVVFLIFILIGYVCGIASKILAGDITYVFTFYIINLVLVFVDFCLYFRNRRLDKQNAETANESSES